MRTATLTVTILAAIVALCGFALATAPPPPQGEVEAPRPEIYQCKSTKGCVATFNADDGKQIQRTFRKGDILSTDAGWVVSTNDGWEKLAPAVPVCTDWPGCAAWRWDPAGGEYEVSLLKSFVSNHLVETSRVGDAYALYALSADGAD